MENKLSLLFDYQKFEQNAELQSVIDSVYARFRSRKLSDEEVWGRIRGERENG